VHPRQPPAAASLAPEAQEQPLLGGLQGTASLARRKGRRAGRGCPWMARRGTKILRWDSGRRRLSSQLSAEDLHLPGCATPPLRRACPRRPRRRAALWTLCLSSRSHPLCTMSTRVMAPCPALLILPSSARSHVLLRVNPKVCLDACRAFLVQSCAFQLYHTPCLLS